jgi:Ca-activated chloride channel family protein
LVDRLIERLIEEGYLTVGEERSGARPDSFASSRRGKTGKPIERSIKFEMTDKGLDFLGFKALKDLVGSLGKSSFGRHDRNLPADDSNRD